MPTLQEQHYQSGNTSRSEYHGKIIIRKSLNAGSFAWAETSGLERMYIHVTIKPHVGSYSLTYFIVSKFFIFILKYIFPVLYLRISCMLVAVESSPGLRRLKISISFRCYIWIYDSRDNLYVCLNLS